MPGLVRQGMHTLGRIVYRRKGLLAIGVLSFGMLLYGQNVVAEIVPSFHERANKASNTQATPVSATRAETESRVLVESEQKSETTENNTDKSTMLVNSESSSEVQDEKVSAEMSQQRGVSIHLEQQSSSEGVKNEIKVNGEDVEVSNNTSTTQRFETEDGSDVRVRIRSNSDTGSSSSFRMSVNGETVEKGGNE